MKTQNEGLKKKRKKKKIEKYTAEIQRNQYSKYFVYTHTITITILPR